MAKGHMCRWTNEEYDYLEESMKEEMSDGQPFPVTAICLFFNNYFVGKYEEYEPRTIRAIRKKIVRLSREKGIYLADLNINSREITMKAKDEDKVAEITEKILEQNAEEEVVPMKEAVISVTVKSGKQRGPEGWDKSVTNSGKRWAILDERYLANNWVSNHEHQADTADYLGRTHASCATKYSSLRKKDDGEYIQFLMGQGNIDVRVNNYRDGWITRIIDSLSRWNEKRLDKKNSRQSARDAKSQKEKKAKRQKEIDVLKAQIQKLEGN